MCLLIIAISRPIENKNMLQYTVTMFKICIGYIIGITNKYAVIEKK